MRCGNAVYEKAGARTICGMQLVEKTSESPSAVAPAASQTGGYVCPPCGAGCDDKTYEKPGGCPICGMRLVAKGSAQAVPNANYRPAAQQVLARGKKVAIFIFDGVQIIDYAGPYEVFGQAGFEVFTVAEKTDAITTAMGMSVNPKYTLDNHPQPNILLIPGGGVTRHQDKPNVIQWIRNNATQAEAVLSVCNGAFFLAKAGLLDGLEATTFASLIAGLQTAAPKTKVVSNKRFVDNGKYKPIPRQRKCWRSSTTVWRPRISGRDRMPQKPMAPPRVCGNLPARMAKLGAAWQAWKRLPAKRTS